MGVIKLLPVSVISGIAAGEVIDRPATIVKELVENALDADATNIEIELEQSGLKKILVRDDGQGMDVTDLQLATTRHTTSKISELRDLHSLRTFGFRGEALASIAAVAKLSILSRTPALPHGHFLEISAEQLTNHTTPTPEPSAAALGTTMMVEHIFQHIPARLKFLKNPATELRLILQAVTQAALMHPKVRFQLTHHQKQLFTLAPHANWDERVAAVLGSSTTRNLLPLSYESPVVKISGFVAVPGSTRKHHGQQYLFVNKRPVHSAALAQRVKLAYGRSLPAAAEPVFLLHLELHPQLVDVNVHPRKEEVRFMDQDQVLQMVEVAVGNAIQESGLLEEAATTQTFTPGSYPASPVTNRWLKEHQPLWQLQSTDTPGAQAILQIDHTYLGLVTDGGLLLIDQHAAHERLIFDQLKELYQRADHRPFRLPQSSVVEVELADATLLQDNLATLASVGIEIEPFGGSSFKINTLPQVLADRRPDKLVQELLDELKVGRPVTQVDSLADRTLAYLACRQAVKAGDYLTPEQRLELVNQLAIHPEKMTCPHGRPIAILISQSELATRFHR